MIVDLFAGPGGWDQGARLGGFAGFLVGIEHDLSACRTATAAGHPRIQADVSTYPLEPFVGKVDGLIGSPPCPTFSSAGQGGGRHVLGILATAMTRTARGHRVLAETRQQCAAVLRRVALAKWPKWTRAERSAWAREQATISTLVLQPLRWILAVRPRWVALEQVPAVLPLWRHMAELLRELGYRAWYGQLSAEQ
ncbi:MAG TPA: DNA cytosine methyltransferase, partial [Nonomuraea sp.]|nr:DNA cytosine methyltransferase [Nonomuraea sp.]